QHDGLTGLYNHSRFQEILQEEMNKKHDVVLIFFDIDHFKMINDTYGHLAGDEVLQFIGTLIQQSGLAARYGGEEFAIILPKYSLEQGLRVASRLKDHLLKSEIKFKQTKLRVTISIGIAHYPTDARTRVDLIEKADRALYRAKQTGRNKIVLARTMEDKGDQDIG
ncbi:MAG: GGDEF domain-containing protein, partial [candidate division WOR-3 bacterium]